MTESRDIYVHIISQSYIEQSNTIYIAIDMGEEATCHSAGRNMILNPCRQRISV